MKMNRKIIFFIFFLIFTIVVVGYFGFWYGSKNAVAPIEVKNNDILDSDDENKIKNEKDLVIEDKKIISEPIENAGSRMTKKPFGIKVSPRNSPVTPERFSGFHTGVDFETYENEQGLDISIYAICHGSILLKKQATGYGGLVVQKCDIKDEIVTVVYGHLNLSSIEKNSGDKYLDGEKIGVLGEEHSVETDGERKHLHLSIHKGSDVNILGYVQNQQALDQWINIEEYLNSEIK